MCDDVVFNNVVPQVCQPEISDIRFSRAHFHQGHVMSWENPFCTPLDIQARLAIATKFQKMVAAVVEGAEPQQ